MTETVWQNRIVGYGEEAPDLLNEHPLNFRVHPRRQQDALAGVLAGVGIVQNVIVNKRTGRIVDGHLRVELAIENEQPTVPITYVDLSEEEEALILSTLDPISAMAFSDQEKLDSLIEQVDTDDDGILALFADLSTPGLNGGDGGGGDGSGEGGGEDGPKYTTKVDSPLYEPTGEAPDLSDLTKTTRYETLIEAIAAADLPEEVDAFLRLAATRHVVFNYSRIAEFYAHAEPEVQELMEDSALVIIDVERAIELGYARLRNILITDMEPLFAEEADDEEEEDTSGEA